MGVKSGVWCQAWRLADGGAARAAAGGTQGPSGALADDDGEKGASGPGSRTMAPGSPGSTALEPFRFRQWYLRSLNHLRTSLVLRPVTLVRCSTSLCPGNWFRQKLPFRADSCS